MRPGAFGIAGDRVCVPACVFDSLQWADNFWREHLQFSFNMTGLVAVEGAPPMKSPLLSDLAVLLSKYDSLFLQAPFRSSTSIPRA